MSVFHANRNCSKAIGQYMGITPSMFDPVPVVAAVAAMETNDGSVSIVQDRSIRISVLLEKKRQALQGADCSLRREWAQSSTFVGSFVA